MDDMMTRSLTRVLNLGGGFAGVAAARYFERHLPRDRGITVTLVSRDNYQLFTPRLAEVATGEIDSTHVAMPTRAFLLKHLGTRRASTTASSIASIGRPPRRTRPSVGPC